MNTAARAVALTLLLGVGLAQAARADGPCARAADDIPPRPMQAPGAQALIRAIADLDDTARDLAIRAALIAGNMPSFVRRAAPVTTAGTTSAGRHVTLTLCVLPDYLAVGSEADFVRVPLALDSALAVAQAFGFSLPTRRIVDLVHRQATVRLQPQPLPASDRMRSAAYLLRHEALVERQRADIGSRPGAITAGHKKDLVLTTRLQVQSGRVAIYGWHRADGTPIQPLSTVHGAHYADYSHGIRLVSRTAYLDGVPVSLFDVIADADLAGLLSDEGPLRRVAAFQQAAARR